MACCDSCAGAKPRLIRGSAPLGFVVPLINAVSAINTARALGAYGSCPEARTSGQRVYSAPWSGSRPNLIELSDWYDKAEEELARASKFPGVKQEGLTKLQRLWEQLPNRVAAMYDSLAHGTRAKEIAQQALCLIHDANQGTTTPVPDLPDPEPSCGITQCCPTDPRPNEPYPKCKIPTFELPWWVFAVGGVGLYLLFTNRRSE